MFLLWFCVQWQHLGAVTLTYQDHALINPWTGVVAWETASMATSFGMEWLYIGLGEVLPTCSGDFDWTDIATRLNSIAARGHTAILRPITVGPGYDDAKHTGSHIPTDMTTSDIDYCGATYRNPRWDLAATTTCIDKFIDAFGAKYKNDNRVAYVQMGLVGLWGEHHLDTIAYTAQNFPTATQQRDMIIRYVNAFGNTASSISLSISLDSTQSQGVFGQYTAALLSYRFTLFDDTLLETGHNAAQNWRQEAVPAATQAARNKYGYGGEFAWPLCNQNGAWAMGAMDCGSGESLANQAARVRLNWVLGSPAVADGAGGVTAAQVKAGSKLIGYKFAITEVLAVGSTSVTVTVINKGTGFSPYTVQVCASVVSGSPGNCAGDLSTLAPSATVTVTVAVALTSTSKAVLFTLSSPRLPTTTKMLWSNSAVDTTTGVLTVQLAAAGGGAVVTTKAPAVTTKAPPTEDASLCVNQVCVISTNELGYYAGHTLAQCHSTLKGAVNINAKFIVSDTLKKDCWVLSSCASFRTWGTDGTWKSCRKAATTAALDWTEAATNSTGCEVNTGGTCEVCTAAGCVFVEQNQTCATTCPADASKTCHANSCPSTGPPATTSGVRRADFGAPLALLLTLLSGFLLE